MDFLKSYIKKTAIPAFILSSFLFNANIFGQDNVKFTASAPKAVENGAQFKIVYSVNAKGSDLKLPEMKNFDFLGGPQTSQSSSYSIVNGKATQSFNLSYTVYFKALKEGTYNIPPATIKVDKQQYKSNSLTIEVVKSSTDLNSQPNQNQNQQNKPKTDKNNPLFYRIFADKKDVYLGEQIVVTIKLFSLYGIDGSESAKMPSYNGFFKQEIETKGILKQEKIDGQIYNTAVVERMILFPQQTGKLTIDSATIGLVLLQQYRDRYGFPRYKRFKQEVVSNKVDINVRPLPPNKPADFNGAVGTFTLNGSVNKTKAKTNDALTFKVVLKGKGNINLVNPPKLLLPPDFETYEPKTNVNISNTIAGQKGTKTFEYLAVPRHAGEFKVAPITLTYFDPDAGRYKTLKTQEFNISIEKGDDTISAPMVVGISKEEIQFLGSDIKYIKLKSKLHKVDSGFFGTILYYLSFPILLLVMSVIIIWRRKHVKQRQNTLLMKNKKANKLAVKRLHKANHHFKAGNNEMFYEEMARAMWGYVSDKLSIPVSDLSKENAKELFEKHNVDNEQTDTFFQIIDDCEFARYAPPTEGGALKELYDRAIKAISKVEQELR